MGPIIDNYAISFTICSFVYSFFFYFLNIQTLLYQNKSYLYLLSLFLLFLFLFLFFAMSYVYLLIPQNHLNNALLPYLLCYYLSHIFYYIPKIVLVNIFLYDHLKISLVFVDKLFSCLFLSFLFLHNVLVYISLLIDFLSHYILYFFQIYILLLLPM